MMAAQARTAIHHVLVLCAIVRECENMFVFGDAVCNFARLPCRFLIASDLHRFNDTTSVPRIEKKGTAKHQQQNRLGSVLHKRNLYHEYRPIFTRLRVHPPTIGYDDILCHG